MLSAVEMTSATRRRPLLWQPTTVSSTPNIFLAAPPGGWMILQTFQQYIKCKNTSAIVYFVLTIARFMIYFILQHENTLTLCRLPNCPTNILLLNILFLKQNFFRIQKHCLFCFGALYIFGLYHLSWICWNRIRGYARKTGNDLFVCNL